MSKSDDLRERVEGLMKISKKLRNDAERLEDEAKRLKNAIAEEARKKPEKPA